MEVSLVRFCAERRVGVVKDVARYAMHFLIDSYRARIVMGKIIDPVTRGLLIEKGLGD